MGNGGIGPPTFWLLPSPMADMFYIDDRGSQTHPTFEVLIYVYFSHWYNTSS